MGAYRLLLSLTVEHAYYSKTNCRMLDFVLTDESVTKLRNLNLLVKSSESGVAVYFDEEKINILRLHSEDDLTLTFKVFSKDNNFFRYTHPGAPPDNAILYFSNQHVTCEVTNKQILHPNTVLIERNHEDLMTFSLHDVLYRKDYFVKPVFILQLKINAGEEDLCTDKLDSAKHKFYIYFTTNQTFWRYYVSGVLSKRNVYIEDLENIIHFKNLGSILLPGNREVVQIQSSEAISLSDQPSQRFQLKEKTDKGGKTLIKRLPNPLVDQMHGEVLNGKVEYISEVYIN